MRRSLASTICLCLASCAVERPSAAFTERDSAGVRIIEYADTPTSRPAFTVSPTPLWRVGDDPAEHQFEFIAMGTLQPDGGAVILDRVPELISFGADGAVRSVLARGGQGPAEVRSVYSISVVGQDTILVEDRGNAKIMVLEDDALVRSIPAIGVTGPFRGVGFQRPSTLLMVSASYRPDSMSAPWHPGRMVRFDFEAGRVDTVGTFDWALYRSPRATFNPFLGSGFAVASGNRFVTMRSDLPELRWWDVEGRLLEVTRWKPTLEYPTDEHVKEYGDAMRAELPRLNSGMSQEQAAQIAERMLSGLDLDRSRPLPLYGFPQEDGSGGVWLSDFSVPGIQAGIPRWSVIAADGRWMGSIVLPDRFRILDIRDDKVLGVFRDSLDVESLAVLRLEPAPR